MQGTIFNATNHKRKNIKNQKCFLAYDHKKIDWTIKKKEKQLAENT